MPKVMQTIEIKKVPTDLWVRIRVIAARRTTTIREVVIDALRQYAEREDK